MRFMSTELLERVAQYVLDEAEEVEFDTDGDTESIPFFDKGRDGTNLFFSFVIPTGFDGYDRVRVVDSEGVTLIERDAPVSKQVSQPLYQRFRYDVREEEN